MQIEPFFRKHCKWLLENLSLPIPDEFLRNSRDIHVLHHNISRMKNLTFETRYESSY